MLDPDSQVLQVPFIATREPDLARVDPLLSSKESGKSQITLSADLIPDEDGGYTVYCPELDIYTQGDIEATRVGH